MFLTRNRHNYCMQLWVEMCPIWWNLCTYIDSWVVWPDLNALVFVGLLLDNVTYQSIKFPKLFWIYNDSYLEDPTSWLSHLGQTIWTARSVYLAAWSSLTVILTSYSKNLSSSLLSPGLVPAPSEQCLYSPPIDAPARVNTYCHSIFDVNVWMIPDTGTASPYRPC